PMFDIKLSTCQVAYPGNASFSRVCAVAVVPGPRNRSDNIRRRGAIIALAIAMLSRDTHGMYIRTVKVPSSSGTVNEYVRVVEAYRQDGKVKQRVIADLGRKDFLQALLPSLERVLRGEPRLADRPAGGDILEVWTWGPVLLIRALFEQLGLWSILDQHLGRPKARDDGAPVSYADRAFVLIANRLVRPSSEHGLARWLETDFVCDRQGRRFVP